MRRTSSAPHLPCRSSASSTASHASTTAPRKRSSCLPRSSSISNGFPNTVIRSACMSVTPGPAGTVGHL
eukprot:2303760-Prymnesium_polylepis.1